MIIGTASKRVGDLDYESINFCSKVRYTIVTAAAQLRNGYILDGHTRYRILKKHGFIKFEVEEIQLANKYEALALETVIRLH